jgi:hypothetical protein
MTGYSDPRGECENSKGRLGGLASRCHEVRPAEFHMRLYRVFADPVVASAIVDRVLHSATVLNIRGASYRMRNYAAQEKLRGGGAMVG